MKDSEGDTDSEVEIMRSRQEHFEDGEISEDELHLDRCSNPVFPADIEAKARRTTTPTTRRTRASASTDQLVTEAEFLGRPGGIMTGAFQILSNGEVVFEREVNEYTRYGEEATHAQGATSVGGREDASKPARYSLSGQDAAA
jgi:hypothetical protein